MLSQLGQNQNLGQTPYKFKFDNTMGIESLPKDGFQIIIEDDTPEELSNFEKLSSFDKVFDHNFNVFGKEKLFDGEKVFEGLQRNNIISTN